MSLESNQYVPYSGKLFNAYITSSLQYLLLKDNTDIQIAARKKDIFSFLSLKVNDAKSHNKSKTIKKRLKILK